MRKSCLFSLLATAPGLYCSETQENTATWTCYNGTRITAENLIELAPKPSAGLNARARMALRHNADLIENALSFEPFIGTVRKSFEQTNALLQKKGLKNYSKYNYNFPLTKDNHQWMFKIAGSFGRHHNLEYALGLPYGTPLTEEHYKKFAETYKQDELDQPSDSKTKLSHVAPKTYQTVSRMAYWLLFDQYKKATGHTITAPTKHLIHIPGRPTDLSDRNYVILAKMMPDLQDVKALSEDKFSTLKQAIHGAERWLEGGNKITLTAKEYTTLQSIVSAIKLFEIHTGNLKRDKDGNLVLLDLEQPNNTAPRFFFGKDAWKANNDARAGLESLAESFGKKS